jgi:hypothetical protein
MCEGGARISGVVLPVAQVAQVAEAALLEYFEAGHEVQVDEVVAATRTEYMPG